MRHISHFTFAMITQNLKHRETMKLLNDRSIHDDLNHGAEKSLMVYLTNIVVSLRVTFCHTPAHRSSSIVPNIARGTLLPTLLVAFLVAPNAAFSWNTYCVVLSWYVILGWSPLQNYYYKRNTLYYSIKLSRTNRRVRWWTKVSRIISLRTRTETILETSVHSTALRGC